MLHECPEWAAVVLYLSTFEIGNPIAVIKACFEDQSLGESRVALANQMVSCLTTRSYKSPSQLHSLLAGSTFIRTLYFPYSIILP